MSSDKPKGPIINDTRFSRVHTDPRFQRMPKKDRKVKVGNRFSTMFTDKNFQMNYIVDKYGRKVKTNKANDLKQYYEMEDEDKEADRVEDAPADTEDAEPEGGEAEGDEGDAEGLEAAEGDESSSSESSDEDEAAEIEEENVPMGEANGSRLAVLNLEWDRVKAVDLLVLFRSFTSGEGAVKKVSIIPSDYGAERMEQEKKFGPIGLWDNNASHSTSEPTVSPNAAAESSSEGESDAEPPSAKQPPTKGTVPLKTSMKKGKAKGKGKGSVQWTKAEEEEEVADKQDQQKGKGKKKNQKSAIDTKAEKTEPNKSSKIKNRQDTPMRKVPRKPLIAPEQDEEDKEDSELELDSDEELAALQGEDASAVKEFDMEKLRKYELDRLRYYIAVVEFDSVATAEKVYHECDGLEFESSANKLDLRFVPDDHSFARDPRDSATSVPGNYKPPAYFSTKALQHSKVELTWDRDDPNRREALKKNFKTGGEGMEDELKAYIASEEDDDGYGTDLPIEEDGVALKRKARGKYAALLADLQPKQEEEEGLEITFEPGLKEHVQKVMDQPQGQGSTWDAYLERRKQKIKDKKAARKAAKKGEANPGEDDDEEEEEEEREDIMQDPFFADAFDGPEFQKPSKNKKKAGDEDDDDDDGDDDGDDDDGPSRKKKEEDEDDWLDKAKAKGGKKENGKGKKEVKGKNEAKEEKGKKGKKGKGKGKVEEESQEDGQKRAELELLLDEDGGDRGYSLQQLVKQHKAEKKKQEKRKKRRGAAGEEDEETTGKAGEGDFSMDVKDPRIQAIFSNPDFQIDPTNPNFRDTAGTETIFRERRKRQREGTGKPGSGAKASSSSAAAAATTGATAATKSKIKDPAVAQLLASVKSKVAAKK